MVMASLAVFLALSFLPWAWLDLVGATELFALLKISPTRHRLVRYSPAFFILISL